MPYFGLHWTQSGVKERGSLHLTADFIAQWMALSQPAKVSGLSCACTQSRSALFCNLVVVHTEDDDQCDASNVEGGVHTNQQGKGLERERAEEQSIDKGVATRELDTFLEQRLERLNLRY